MRPLSSGPHLPLTAHHVSAVPPGFGREGCRRLLEWCLRDRDLVLGSRLHARIVTAGLQGDSFLAAKLVSFYSLCGNPSAAEAVFDGFVETNVFVLNAAIRGYVCNGLHRRAIHAFCQKREGVVPDSSTFSCVAKACALLSDLRKGRRLHGLAVASGLGSDLFVSNSLVCMYARCGSLADGVQVFERMPRRDTVSWNSVISAYARGGFDREALDRVREMVGRGGLRPDCVTLVSVLAACFSAETVEQVHGYAVRNGFESTSTVRNALISAYGKCGRVREARWAFNNYVRCDKVSWNALISCYAQNGFFEESMQLLRDMRASEIDLDVITYSGIISSLAQDDKPGEALEVFRELLGTGFNLDVITIASILPAISDLHCVNLCKEMHAYSYRHGMESERRVRNALVSVYGKCALIPYASGVFEEIGDRDVISWSSMVASYAQNGLCNEALHVFRQMITVEIEPNPISITSVLDACSAISGLKQGKEIHLWAVKNAVDGQTFVGSALIDMYAKCGRIIDSRRVFDLMKEKNLVTWNSMIGGYAFHGLGEEALKIFHRLEEPDEVSFIAALSACSHGGLVAEGIAIFNRMKDFNVSPREAHYACMVDILGRSGKLDRAMELIRTMPVEASTTIWGSLLGACKIYCNLDMGIHSGMQIIGSGSTDSGYYVTLSNILAEFGRWSDVEVTRGLMNEKGVKKGIGCTWIEVNKEVHSFVAKSRVQHPEWGYLFRVLTFLNEHMKGMSC
uniref:Pentatricopeptide repeat-containing protein At5g16860 n=1 Tax=Anthurium amnicola TaxID=1678845 RepID=A0A1D1Z651_9ARAE